jgi:cytochrome oxidase Cu insertion factor (SCO1/SenC/PrrC family)
MKKGVVAIIIIAIIIAIAIFTFSGNNTNSQNSQEPNNQEPQNRESQIENSLWYNAELKNINTGETFTISQLNDKPILLESFAVWCPTCTRQQKEIKALHDEIGESVVSVSLDTDANEDESKVLAHTQENGFTWHYAVSPSDVTQSLIDDFGVGIVNAPSAPLILICPDSSIKEFGRGIKKVSELKEAIASCQ